MLIARSQEEYMYIIISKDRIMFIVNLSRIYYVYGVIAFFNFLHIKCTTSLNAINMRFSSSSDEEQSQANTSDKGRDKKKRKKSKDKDGTRQKLKKLKRKLKKIKKERKKAKKKARSSSDNSCSSEEEEVWVEKGSE